MSLISTTVWMGALHRKSNAVVTKAAVAVARKLCVALWQVMMGHLIGALERLDTLQTKLSKFATELGPAALSAFGYNNKVDFVKKKLYVLRSYP